MICPGLVLSEINRRAPASDGTVFGDRGYERPPGEPMVTAECCRLIMRATQRGDRKRVMTWRGRSGRLITLISPLLVDRIDRRAVEGKQ